MSSVLSANSSNGKGGGLVPGEFLLTQRDFHEIAAMIHEDAGIHLPQSKAALVYSRLAKRLRALGSRIFVSIAGLSPRAMASTNARKCLPP